MSSSFSREQLCRKLRDLTESGNSITTLSLWLLHHKKVSSLSKTLLKIIRRNFCQEISQKNFKKILTLFHLNSKILTPQVASDCVKVWLEEIKTCKPSHQLNLLYLANDIIQNGKRKGTVPEYIKVRDHFFITELIFVELFWKIKVWLL